MIDSPSSAPVRFLVVPHGVCFRDEVVEATVMHDMLPA